MANYSQLKLSVKNVIKQNGQQEITGEVLQGVLLSIIQNLGTNAQYKGVATPSTNPGTPDGNVFYFAVQTGTYTNMGNLQVSASDGLSVLVYNGTWAKAALGVALKTDITGVQNQITQLNTKITAAKNLIQRINALIKETAAVNLGITYQNLLSGVQNGDIKALQDSNGSLYGVIVIDGTLYAYCQVSIVDEGAYPLAGASYILTDAGSGNIKIESGGTELKLPYLDGNNKIPESMLPDNIDDINTLKSKARYEYSLPKILALTDTSAESVVKEAFTPTYAPEGSLSPRVPKAGDLLIDGNNTVVVSEGTQIFFSFTYDEEIISMRVFSTGSNFKFNVWKFPAGTVYDFNSIDTLTESSTADDIKEALTPKIGDGMRIPNSGDIMLIGIEENPDTVSVLYRYRNTFAYYSNRLLTTIDVKGEDDSLSVVKTVSRYYVYDFDKTNALTNDSTFSDIMHAFSPLIIDTEGHIPKTGDLLTSGYDEEGNAVRSAKVICHNGNSFAYCYDGKHVTVELVGKLGNPDMRVEKTVSSDVVRLSAALEEGQSVDIGMTFSELKEKNPTFLIDANKQLFYCPYIDASSGMFTTILPADNDKKSLGFNRIIVITDAGSGKVNISANKYSYIVPQLGSDGKLPVEVMPDNFIAGTGVTAIQTVTELPQSPDSGTLYLIMPSETKTSEEQL